MNDERNVRIWQELTRQRLEHAKEHNLPVLVKFKGGFRDSGLLLRWSEGGAIVFTGEEREKLIFLGARRARVSTAEFSLGPGFSRDAFAKEILPFVYSIAIPPVTIS
ncbi:MAG: hypothetical protein UY56_C0019G0002 [Parcubacteria group bacterium GW2011_GWA1_50_14]|nr:MAG: hypothetical protein UY56_C0019G0002 [Parcubacteria group bacterium GW2011_GWA1_50_14]